MAGQVTTTAPAAPSGIAGWAGLLVPYNKPSVDGRMIERPPGGARVRDLPIELKYQESATCGHDNALIGLASITRTWETEEGLWGSGPFDMADPRGAELARKVHEGFVGHVSVDLGDFKTSAKQTPRGVLESVTDWKLLSTTIVADAAMDGARIFTVSEPDKIVPMSEPLSARRQAAGVFSSRDTATLTFANNGDAAEFAPELTLTITGATSLPWAPRDTPWDRAAATRRMVEHCGGKDNLNPQCFARGHMYRDNDADPTLIGSYKFPFADVINGQVRAVFRGVASAAANVDKAGITSADKEALQSRIRTLYASAARAFGDDTLKAPFDATDHTTLRTVEMAEKAPAADAMAEVNDEVNALSAAIAESLAPQLSETISRAIREAIQGIVDSTTGGDTGGDTDEPDEAPQPEAEVAEEETTVEEMPEADPAAAMSALILRMARATAEYRRLRRGARKLLQAAR